jgi:hypothetical protein
LFEALRLKQQCQESAPNNFQPSSIRRRNVGSNLEDNDFESCEWKKASQSTMLLPDKNVNSELLVDKRGTNGFSILLFPVTLVVRLGFILLNIVWLVVRALFSAVIGVLTFLALVTVLYVLFDVVAQIVASSAEA